MKFTPSDTLHPKTLAEYAALFTARRAELPDHLGVVSYREANAECQPTCIVVHGLTGTHYSMLQMAGPWAERGYRVIAIDLPGHGKSGEPSLQTAEDLAGWLDAVLQKVYPTGDFVLVGNSFGCGVCVEYVRHYGLRGASRLLLTAPIPSLSRFLSPFERATAKLPESLMHAIYYENVMLEEARIAVLLSRHGKSRYRPAVKESIRSESALVRHRYAYATLMRIAKQFPPYQTPLPLPVQRRMTVLLGDEDRIAGRRARAILTSWAPESLVTVVPHCGHLVHIEAVDEATSALEQLIDQM